MPRKPGLIRQLPLVWRRPSVVPNMNLESRGFLLTSISDILDSGLASGPRSHGLRRCLLGCSNKGGEQPAGPREVFPASHFGRDFRPGGHYTYSLSSIWETSLGDDNRCPALPPEPDGLHDELPPHEVRPLVTSSKMRWRGPSASALAMARRCLCPPLEAVSWGAENGSLAPREDL